MCACVSACMREWYMSWGDWLILLGNIALWGMPLCRKHRLLMIKTLRTHATGLLCMSSVRIAQCKQITCGHHIQIEKSRLFCVISMIAYKAWSIIKILPARTHPYRAMDPSAYYPLPQFTHIGTINHHSKHFLNWLICLLKLENVKVSLSAIYGKEKKK